MTLSATDNVGVTGYYLSESSITPSTATLWTTVYPPSTNYSANVSFTLSISSGIKTVYNWFRDAVGNISAVVSDSIILGSAPSAPTGVSATAGNGQATISWSSVSDATSYNIYWSTTSGVTKTTGTKITGATSPYTHTGLTNGTTYYYVVTAVNSYGESSESSQVSAIPTAPTPTTLASGLNQPKHIAVDSTNVYRTESSYVKKVGINGGSFTTLASEGGNSLSQIAVDSNSVYWTVYGYGDGYIKKVGINGGTVTTLASGLDQPHHIAVDSTNVYWTEESSNGTVKKVSINGGSVTTLASGLSSPNGIAIDSTNVYWAETTVSGTVKKIAK